MLLAGGGGHPAHAQPTPWLFFGHDTGNTRGQNSVPGNINQPFQINPRTAPSLALKWSTSVNGDVSATPTVEPGGLYFPDYNGYLYKLDPDTGEIIWSTSLANYMGGEYGYSRSSPAIGALGEIVIGDNSPNTTSNPGARVISVNKMTGALNWVAVVDPSPNAYVTGSPVIYNGLIYLGLTTNQFAFPVTDPTYVPTFRGRVMALDEATGAIKWQFYTVPPGYTGADMWGSSPVVFTPTHSLIVGTGNNFSVPPSVSACYVAAGASLPAQYACMDPANYVDSILSLDLTTGAVNWSRRFGGADTLVA